MSLPVVAIVGRPNVGKSSLFNRFIQRKKAVVDPISGVTRDRNYALCDWNGREFRLVDTGGIVPGSKDSMEQAIKAQSEFAIEESDLVLLVVDAQTGTDQTDRQLARDLLRSEKPVILVANKVDAEEQEPAMFEAVSLGLGEPMPTSATVGRGVGDLLDRIVSLLPEAEDNPSPEGTIRVALVGRPNVGKSSFINKLLGQDRLIVSEKAGTTRDAVDTPFTLDGRNYVLCDTAGLRRKYRVHENIEFYTNVRVMRALDDCDVAVVLINAADGFTTQDKRVLTIVVEHRRAAVLAVNKWDLIEKDDLTADKTTAKLRDDLGPNSFVPIIYISALTGQRVAKVLSMVDDVYAEHHKRIPTSDLNDLLQHAFARRKPPAKQGKFIQFKYVTQSEVAPPTFVFFVNHPTLVDKTYLYYLANQLRGRFGFVGSPIRLKCRRK